MHKALVLVCCLFLALPPLAGAAERIKVCNYLGRDICEFYISAHNETDWGEDLLEGLEECLHHGNCTKADWPDTGSNALNYDLRVVFRDDSDRHIENYKVRWAQGGTTVFNLNE